MFKPLQKNLFQHRQVEDIVFELILNDCPVSYDRKEYNLFKTNT